MTLGNIMPKRLNARFKKCGETNVIDLPGGTLEMCTVHAPSQPTFMGDPLLNYGSGQYPKSALLSGFYDNLRIWSAWSKCTISTAQQEPCEMFMYPHISGTPRHVDTDGKNNLCMIPRIKFKKFPKQTADVNQRRSQTMFRRVRMTDLYPKWSNNPEGFVSSFSGSTGNEIFFHCGIVTAVETVPLTNHNVNSMQDVGVKTTMFRRDEVANP